LSRQSGVKGVTELLHIVTDPKDKRGARGCPRVPCRARHGIRSSWARCKFITSASGPFELSGGIGRLAPAEVRVMFAIVEIGGVPEATTMSDYFLGTSAFGH